MWQATVELNFACQKAEKENWSFGNLSCLIDLSIPESDRNTVGVKIANNYSFLPSKIPFQQHLDITVWRKMKKNRFCAFVKFFHCF
jgi:hypothetical protein